MKPEARVALSLQRALLGAVTPRLRQVWFRLDGTEISLHFTYDGEVTDGDREEASIVGAEVIADMAPEFDISETCTRSDFPAPLNPPEDGRVVYRRKESYPHRPFT